MTSDRFENGPIFFRALRATAVESDLPNLDGILGNLFGFGPLYFEIFKKIPSVCTPAGPPRPELERVPDPLGRVVT